MSKVLSESCGPGSQVIHAEQVVVSSQAPQALSTFAILLSPWRA